MQINLNKEVPIIYRYPKAVPTHRNNGDYSSSTGKKSLRGRQQSRVSQHECTAYYTRYTESLIQPACEVHLIHILTEFCEEVVKGSILKGFSNGASAVLPGNTAFCQGTGLDGTV